MKNLILWQKSYDNLDSILKNITLPTKFHIIKAMVNPLGRYRCDSWIIKKAEC